MKPLFLVPIAVGLLGIGMACIPGSPVAIVVNGKPLVPLGRLEASVHQAYPAQSWIHPSFQALRLFLFTSYLAASGLCLFLSLDPPSDGDMGSAA